MTAAAVALTDQTQPDTLKIAENAPSATQRAGNGVLVNGQTRHVSLQSLPEGFGGPAAGKRKPSIVRRRQAEAFANTCHELLLVLREQMGMNQPHPSESTNGQSASQTNGENGGGTCDSKSISSAFASLKEASAVAVNLTRGWDTALERLRIERGVPDPGCRRPGEPVPKSRKPTNRAPDSLACGSDTPTGSVPREK